MINITDWIADNYIEIFGAVTGILYVFLEIKQNLWLWPVGIITSAVYIWVFLNGKLYADMSLQVYYLGISILGWYWWLRGRVPGKKNNISFQSARDSDAEPSSCQVKEILKVSRLKRKTGIILTAVFIILFAFMWFILSRLTDSPVPGWDSFITSLSIIATWMLARKIFEHWYLWIIVNAAAVTLFFFRALYPTVILYTVYCAMSFAGIVEWRKSISKK